MLEYFGDGIHPQLKFVNKLIFYDTLISKQISGKDEIVFK